jgi:hypothetical protein
MSGVSNASTPCEVIYDVFRNKTQYGTMFQALQRAQDYHAQGKFYCVAFTNPLNGSITYLKGERIIEICNYPNRVVWCNAAEQVAGTVLLNANFFGTVIWSYTKALKHHQNLTSFCQTIKVPLSLYPQLPANQQSFTIRGDQIVALMYAAIGGSPIPATCCAALVV